MAQANRITIRKLLSSQSETMKMRLVAGEPGLDRYIDHPRIQKPSLAFAGFIENLSDYRLQVIGQTELHYLAGRSVAEQRRAVDDVFDLRLAGVVITRNITPPDIILQAARRTDTPLIISEVTSSEFMTHMAQFLSAYLAPVTYQHGVYLDVFGLGVLVTGASGIGKSEIGLELISRGHRLIADDMVEFARHSKEIIVGKSPENLRYHMEIRGLGILNIRDLYGAAAITDSKRLSLIVELLPWDKLAPEERIMGETGNMKIHDVVIPLIPIPIRPGRSLAVLIEVATRNQLLKQRGINSSENFAASLQQRINKGRAGQ
jgi:HPr kinase/phosphorylase